MKKILSFLIIVTICCTFMSPVCAYEEYIGDMYSTDTTAYIDCRQIPVYVFQGYPYVIAEDLNGYGFDIKWSQYENTLYLTYNPAKKYFPYSTVETSIVNTYAGAVYSSDVKVMLNGVEIPSYSLNGRMLISLDELWRFGKVNWYNDSRTIGVTTHKFIEKNPDWEILLPPWYIARKAIDHAQITFDDCSSWMNEVVYAAEQDMRKYRFSAPEDYHKLLVSREYLEELLSYIENNKFLYERSNLYHLTYNIILSTYDIEGLYKTISSHNISWILDNTSYLERYIDSSSMYADEIVSISNDLYDAINRYIVFE